MIATPADPLRAGMPADHDPHRRPAFTPGTLVSARGREWVVLPPGDDPDVLRLRPLGAPDAHATGLSLTLEGDGVRSATLAPPSADYPGDFTSAQLLRDAARLAFRNGAAPLRALAHVNVQPRAYQLVPLLMALQLDPVRLLLGDGVGIGKTIEAGLIARELIDRGEVRRLVVVCPAALCEQWAAELWTKFHLRADIVRPGTVAALERQRAHAGLPANETIFDGPGHLVVSIDYIKSDRRVDAFVRGCPDLVIVDEAHGVARPGGQRAAAQQQRHELVRRLVARADRHVILATATPHSGDQGAFASLVGLLRPDLEAAVEATGEGGRPIDAALRDALRAHVILRGREDVRRFAGHETAFPRRKDADETYHLSGDELAILRDTVVACHAYVDAGGTVQHARRLRYWAALSLLRCVASSPAAGLAALDARLAPRTRDAAVLPAPEGLGPASLPAGEGQGAGDIADARGSAFDHGEGDDDGVPFLEDAGPADAPVRSRFQTLRDRIAAWHAGADRPGARDQKFVRLEEVVRQLLAEGYNPIIFCRYLATAAYVAEALRGREGALARAAGVPARDLGIECITGDTPPDDRVRAIEALAGTGGEEPTHARRILVATDCLSEGINLQAGFNAVVHYDMAWNLTRHDQRAGRVDRFGQPSAEVRVAGLVGENNALDQAVLRVWKRRAANIAATLGISVPVPFDYVDVLTGVFDQVLVAAAATQLALPGPDGDPLGAIGRAAAAGADAVEVQWQDAEARVRRERGHFTQEHVRPDEVLDTVDRAEAALGAPADVQRFVHEALRQLTGTRLRGPEDAPTLVPSELPPGVLGRLDLSVEARDRRIALVFDAARARAGVQVVTRTHPIVEALAGYLLDRAIDDPATAPARRSGATLTTAVARRTALVLVRTRTMLAAPSTDDGPAPAPLLAEECFFVAAAGNLAAPDWLDPEAAAALAATARPTGNLDDGARSRMVADVLADLDRWRPHLDRVARARGTAIRDAFDALRRASDRRARRHAATVMTPVDILAVHVLVPDPFAAGGAR